MAIKNDPRIYSEFSSVLNSQPQVNFYAQLLARKQAKEDALDEYYRKLPSSINDAGMRDQERPLLNKQVDEAMKFWMQNREEMRNPKLDNGRSQLEFEQRIRGAKQTVDESKQLGKKGLDLGMMRVKGENPHIWKSKDIIERLRKLELPLNDPEHEDFDLAKAVIPPKPYTQKEETEAFNAAIGKRTAGKEYDYTNVAPIKGSGQIKLPYTKKFNEQQVKEIASAYADNALQNYDDAQNKYFDLLHDADWTSKANTVFKKYFPKEGIVDDEHKAALAHGLMKAEQSIETGTDLRADSELAFQRQKELKRLANDYIVARQNYRDTKNAKVIDDYVESQYNDPKAKLGYVTYEGERYDGKFVKAPKVLTDKYSINVGTDKEPVWKEPKWLLTSDRKNMIPVYDSGTKTTTGAKFVTPDSKPLSIADYKVTLSNDWLKSSRTAAEIADELDNDEEDDNTYGNTTSGSTTNIVRSGSKSTKSTSVPTGTRAEWKKAGWTDAQIDEKAKAGAIKVK